MARPGVGPRRDETPAVGVSGSGFGTGLASDAASSPDPEAVFVVCHELLGRLNRRAPRQTLLYVDVNGVALVDAKTARCVSRAAFNELTSWCAVDARVFELKQLGVETRKLESRRFEMPKAGVAAELDAAMRSRVRLYVERPDEVRRLRATAAAFRTGDRVRREALARAHGLGGGGGETAIRGEAVASASRDENVPFATFGRKESADWEALRVASATPGERLAQDHGVACARRRPRHQPDELLPGRFRGRVVAACDLAGQRLRRSHPDAGVAQTKSYDHEFLRLTLCSPPRAAHLVYHDSHAGVQL
mgnify:CR=1 FL=1